MTQKSRITHVYLCDNVFQDQRNKWNLIGVFTGDVLLPTMPGRLRAALYIELEMYDSENVLLELYLGKKRVATVTAAVDSTDGAQKGTGVLGIPGVELGIEKPMVFRIVGKVGDQPKRTVFRKEIRAGEGLT